MENGQISHFHIYQFERGFSCLFPGVLIEFWLHSDNSSFYMIHKQFLIEDNFTHILFYRWKFKKHYFFGFAMTIMKLLNLILIYTFILASNIHFCFIFHYFCNQKNYNKWFLCEIFTINLWCLLCSYFLLISQKKMIFRFFMMIQE